MWGFLLIIISAISSIIGLISNNQSKDERPIFFLGLNNLGLTLFTLSIIGFILGLGQEIPQANNRAKKIKTLNEEVQNLHKQIQDLPTFIAIKELEIVEEKFVLSCYKKTQKLEEFQEWLQALPEEVQANRQSDQDLILSVARIGSNSDVFKQYFLNQIEEQQKQLKLLDRDIFSTDFDLLKSELDSYAENMTNIVVTLDEFIQENILRIVEEDTKAIYRGNKSSWRLLKMKLEDEIKIAVEGVKTAKKELLRFETKSQDSFKKMKAIL